jgi:hypothetical protein
MNLLVQIFVLFLLLNAFFWGFASHKQHCKVAAAFGMKKCPPHWIHVYVMGLGSFLVALLLVQGRAGL